MRFIIFVIVALSMALWAVSNHVAFAEINIVDPDLEAIQALWAEFKEAHEDNDRERILAVFAPQSRKRYAKLYDYLNDTSSMPSRWREFTPIERTADFYQFALIQTDPNGEHLYTVSFVHIPNLGWRIESM